MVQINNYFITPISLYYNICCLPVESVEDLQALNKTYPKNTFILSQLGKTLYYGADLSAEKSCVYFRQLRRADPNYMDGMDAFALALFQQDAENELSKLASELLLVNPTRPEGW